MSAMSDTEEPRGRVYLGTYEAGLRHLIVPREALAAVEQQLDAARAQRETEAAGLASLAEAERLRRTRKARALRKLGKTLKAFVRLS
jgi:hypothetical protein